MCRVGPWVRISGQAEASRSRTVGPRRQRQVEAEGRHGGRRATWGKAAYCALCPEVFASAESPMGPESHRLRLKFLFLLYHYFFFLKKLGFHLSFFLAFLCDSDLSTPTFPKIQM